MPLQSQGAGADKLVSPGGFEFGLQGWNWGEPRIKSITFFLDNTAMVCDQHGRAIKGAEVDGKRFMFAIVGPELDDSRQRYIPRPGLATHAQVIDAITAERVDWLTVTFAGWPQLPYVKLKGLMDAGRLPGTPLDELRKIHDKQLRQDALKARREADAVRQEELSAQQEE